MMYCFMQLMYALYSLQRCVCVYVCDFTSYLRPALYTSPKRSPVTNQDPLPLSTALYLSFLPKQFCLATTPDCLQ